MNDLSKLSPETRSIVEAITLASRIDERKIVDDILKDTARGQGYEPDILYIDLSADRSKVPLSIDGAGTLLHAVEATDDLANISVGFGQTESDSNRRIIMKDGKRIYRPFVRAHIYHDAQSGKYMKLMRGIELPSLRVGVEDDSGESANSDLVTALGNSAGFTPTQATVTTSSGVIIAANSSRKRVTLCNTSTGTTVYINDGVATTSHFPLLPGVYLTLNTTAEIRGIVGTGSVVVGVLEE